MDEFKDQAARNTYKGHGQPQSFYFWGTGAQADDQDGLLVTSVETGGTTLTLSGLHETRTVDVRTRFWASPAPAEVAKTAPARTRRPNQPCRCGCGATANGRRGSLYLQGHDARHVSQLVARIFADSDVNLADLTDELAELPTQALRDKAARMVERRIAVAA